MKKLLLIDSDEIYAFKLNLFLSKRNNIKIVAVCSNGEKGLMFLFDNSQDIDVVLINVSPAKRQEIESAKEIKKKYPKIKLIIGSVYPYSICKEIHKETGADDYICKMEDFTDVLNAVLD